MRHPLALLVLCIAPLSGCGAGKSYALPLAGQQPQQTFEPLVRCANARSYQTERTEDGVEVKLDEHALIRYQADPGGAYNMFTLTDAPDNARLAALKSEGDALYACATKPSAPQVLSAAPEASPTAGSCSRLMSCYRDLTQTLCPPNDAACNNSFRLSATGDEAVCTAALQHIGLQIQPFKIAQPNFQLPKTCMVTPSSGSAVASAGAPSGKTSDWSGNWMAKFDYGYRCSMPMNKPEDGKNQASYSLTISGPATALVATVNTSPTGYELHGASNAQGGLRLCGALPLRGVRGSLANTRENNVCMVIDPASSDQARGQIEGDYETTVERCKLQQGARVELSR